MYMVSRDAPAGYAFNRNMIMNNGFLCLNEMEVGVMVAHNNADGSLTFALEEGGTAPDVMIYPIGFVGGTSQLVVANLDDGSLWKVDVNSFAAEKLVADFSTEIAPYTEQGPAVFYSSCGVSGDAILVGSFDSPRTALRISLIPEANGSQQKTKGEKGLMDNNKHKIG